MIVLFDFQYFKLKIIFTEAQISIKYFKKKVNNFEK